MKGAGGAEEDVVPPAGAHPREQMAGEDGRGAAAAGAACVSILGIRVIDQDAAVFMTCLLYTSDAADE